MALARPKAAPAHRLCVAPMMQRTDRHFRYLMRLIAPHAWLYTEMITTGALLHGAAARHLRFAASEHPVAAQLGGADPAALARASRLAEREGYDEINLNVGCPSGRVSQGEFGVALMRNPGRVADCVAAMRDAVAIPVTVKTRLGVDELDDYAFLAGFVDRIVAVGCRTVFVHARKAWLEGLNPKQNREIPPLDYARVHRLKRDFPDTEIVVNGGLSQRDAIMAELEHVDGVMLGRSAYREPMLIGALDRELFGAARCLDVEDVLGGYLAYVESELARGTPLKHMTRHLMGLPSGFAGARRWRGMLGELPEGARGFDELVRAVDCMYPSGFDVAAVS